MFTHNLRRALVFSTTAVLAAAQIAAAQDGRLVPMQNSDETGDAPSVTATTTQVDDAAKAGDTSALTAPMRVFVHRATPANTGSARRQTRRARGLGDATRSPWA